MDSVYLSELRVIIHVQVSDIPGEASKRQDTLAQAICQHLLHRQFRGRPQTTGYDGMHIPSEVDSPLPLKRWIIYDFNVTREMSEDELQQVPHRCFLASRQNDAM